MLCLPCKAGVPVEKHICWEDQAIFQPPSVRHGSSWSLALVFILSQPPAFATKRRQAFWNRS